MYIMCTGNEVDNKNRTFYKSKLIHLKEISYQIYAVLKMFLTEYELIAPRAVF